MFLDIFMPGGMNGLQLAEMVRRLYPDMTVLLTTGYSSSAQDAVRRGFAVLQKPYDLPRCKARCATRTRRPRRRARRRMIGRDCRG